MPFWTFFGATLLGKAVVKVNLQAAFFITIFTDSHMRQVEKFVERLTPDSWNLDEKVNRFLLDCRHRFHAAHNETKADHESGDAQTSEITQIGSAIMILFILFFAKSCIEQLAQQHAAEEDERKLKRKN